MSVTVPSTQHGCPAAPKAMSSPLAICGAPSTKNGPKTVASVASAYASLLIAIVCIDRPSTSESSTNSWRVSVVMCPLSVRKPIAAVHSSSVRRTSRAKACRCRVSACITCLRRGDDAPSNDAMTCSTSACSRAACSAETVTVVVPCSPGSFSGGSGAG